MLEVRHALFGWWGVVPAYRSAESDEAVFVDFIYDSLGSTMLVTTIVPTLMVSYSISGDPVEATRTIAAYEVLPNVDA